MNHYEDLLKELKEQEKTLQFNEFTAETALSIGLRLIEIAKAENKIITIDITKHSHQVFHYSFEGTSPDNDCWVKRKNNIVNRFYSSSFYVGTRLKSKETTLEEKYNVSSFEYAPYGGAFPIRIKNAGVIGTITVSGLTQEEDHNMVVRAIKEYLNY